MALAQMSPQQAAELARQTNLAQRGIVVAQSKFQRKMTYAGAVNPAENRKLVRQVRNVGLITGQMVRVQFTIRNPSTTLTLRPTIWGGFNLLKNVKFVDFSNVTRIDISGRFLNHLNTVRGGRGFGAAEQYPFVADYGQNNNRLQYLPEIPPETTVTAFAVFWVPASYSDTDLTGAVWANVTSANAYLELDFPSDAEISTTATAGNGQAADKAAYYGGAAVVQGIQVEIVQHHYDQIPTANGLYIVPTQDLQNVYELKSTRYTDGFVAGGEVKIQFPTGRSYLSVACNALNGPGVAHEGEWFERIKLEQANSYEYFDLPPDYFAFDSRRRIGLDSPIGMIHYETRSTPIVPEATGNLELMFKVKSGITIDPSAQIETAFEALGPAILPANTFAQSL